jgi:hypothetical protein
VNILMKFRDGCTCATYTISSPSSMARFTDSPSFSTTSEMCGLAQAPIRFDVASVSRSSRGPREYCRDAS